jgi:hypothetical protein
MKRNQNRVRKNGSAEAAARQVKTKSLRIRVFCEGSKDADDVDFSPAEHTRLAVAARRDGISIRRLFERAIRHMVLGVNNAASTPSAPKGQGRATA